MDPLAASPSVLQTSNLVGRYRTRLHSNLVRSLSKSKLNPDDDLPIGERWGVGQEGCHHPSGTCLARETMTPPVCKVLPTDVSSAGSMAGIQACDEAEKRR